MINPLQRKPETRHGKTFDQVVLDCAVNIELVKEFDKLHKTNFLAIAGDKGVLMKSIEGNAAKNDKYDLSKNKKLHVELKLFMNFVHQFIWSPMPVDVIDKPKPTK
jgi:hypothetical protein